MNRCNRETDQALDVGDRGLEADQAVDDVGQPVTDTKRQRAEHADQTKSGDATQAADELPN